MTVGDLAVTTADGVTTVARRLTLRRAMAAVWPVAALLAAVLVPLAVHVRGVRVGPGSVALVVVAAVGFGWLTAANLLALASDRDRWGFTSAGLGVAGDGERPADDLLRPSADIVDVAVEPVRRPFLPVSRPAVIAIESCGVRHVLAVGRRRRMGRVAAAVRAGLDLGPDPLGRSAYPPEPRRGRVDRQVGPTRVTVTIRAAGRAVPVCAFVVTCVGFALSDHFAGIRRKFIIPPATFRQVAWEAAPVVADAAVLGVVMGVGRLLGRHRRLLSVLVTVDANGYDPVVAVRERRGRRVTANSWPLDRVVGPRLAARPGGRRADLSLLLDDDGSVPLVSNGRVRDLRYARDTLVVALSRPSRPPDAAAVVVPADPAGPPDPDRLGKLPRELCFPRPGGI